MRRRGARRAWRTFTDALLLGAAWLLAAPPFAQACAVCAGGNPANRFAFFASTIALSLLPLGLFAGGFLWARARILERFSDEFTERDAVPTPVKADAASLPANAIPDAR